MIIDAEFLDGLDTAVDQPQSMLLATGEAKSGRASIVDAGAGGNVAGAVTTYEVHLSVDQVVVGWWSNGIFICKVNPHHAFENGEVIPVVVVV